MGDYVTVAAKFTEYYYDTFDKNRPGLAGLYRDSSLLTFESSQIQGAVAISDKLNNLGFTSTTHTITTADAQPLPGGAGILVLVTGTLKADESTFNFSQTFILLPEGGTYYVAHDIFKLIFG